MVFQEDFVYIKSYHHARMVLKYMVDNQKTLAFNLEEGKRLEVGVTNEGKYNWYEASYEGLELENLVELLGIEEDIAVKKLYEVRKYFNRVYN